MNGGYVKPFGLNLIRVGVCAILLWGMYFFAKERVKIRKEDYGRFLLCALTGIAINQLFFIEGLSLTYSIHASLLMLSTPILITIIAATVLRERLTVYKILGLGLGVLGATVLIAGRDRSGNADDVLLGDIFILVNAISYTIYFVLVKPLMTRYKPVVVIRNIFTMGFFMILPFCLKQFNEIQWATYDTVTYVNLLSVVITGTFLAYIFNLYGIKVLGASMAGTYIYSQPVMAAIIAIIFLGESLDVYKIIAGVCIAFGVYLSNKKIKNA